MKTIIPIIIMLAAFAGCAGKAETVPAASTTVERIDRTMKDILDAKDATERAAIEVQAMPDQPHKEAAATFLQTASKSLEGAIDGADKTRDSAKKDAKAIENYKSEVAAKIRGYAWPFLIGGFALIAGGIVALKFGISLGTTGIRVGAGAMLAGILILSLSNTIATIVSITTIIMTAGAVVLAVWFVWHWIAYMRRGESVVDAAVNAAGDVGAGQAGLDEVKK